MGDHNRFDEIEKRLARLEQRIDDAASALRLQQYADSLHMEISALRADVDNLKREGIMAESKVSVKAEVSEQHLRDSLADALRDIANSVSPEKCSVD